MNGEGDPFDLGALRIDTGLFARRAQRRKHQFVAVPMVWVERLGAARHAATLKVALRLLHLNFRDRGRPVQLGNLALARGGISRKQKRRALVELERLGLARITWRARKSPIVTAIEDPE